MNNMIIAIYGIAAVLLCGWCANVYKLLSTGLQFAEFGGMEIMRIIGIFVAPLGGVLGFL